MPLLLSRRAAALAARVLADLRVQREQPLAQRVPGLVGGPAREVVEGGHAARGARRRDLGPGHACVEQGGNE